MSQSSFLAAVLTVGVAVAGKPLAAQAGGPTTRKISGDPTCSACRIAISSSGTALDGSANTAVQTPTWVYKGPDGRFLVMQQPTALPIVFSADTRQIHVLGRRGAGPGELQAGNRGAFGPDGSIAVLDGSARRVSVFGRSLEFVRSFRLSGAISDFAWLADGTFVVAGDIPSADRIGYSLHFLTADGTIARSAKLAAGPVGPGARAPNRLLQAKGPGEFAMAEVAEHVSIEVWRGGTRRQSWVYDSPFLPDDKAESEGRPFAGRLSAFYLTDSGLVYLLTTVPKATWRDGIQVTKVNGEEVIRVVDPEKMIGTVVEVLDLTQGKVLARLRAEVVYSGFLPGPSLYRSDDSDERGTRIVIDAVRFVR